MSVSFYPNWLQCYQNTEPLAAGAEKCSCAHFGALQSPPGVDVRPMSSQGLRSIRLKRGPTKQPPNHVKPPAYFLCTHTFKATPKNEII